GGRHRALVERELDRGAGVLRRVDHAEVRAEVRVVGDSGDEDLVEARGALQRAHEVVPGNAREELAGLAIGRRRAARAGIRELVDAALHADRAEVQADAVLILRVGTAARALLAAVEDELAETGRAAEDRREDVEELFPLEALERNHVI